jgi:raffinose/stachyose/melibiose transport system substrate-binding protein
MLPDGVWQANAIADAIEDAGTGFEFGYMQVPAGDNAADNRAYVGKGDLMWFVHADSEMKEQAMLWLEFASRPENYTDFINTVGWLPTQDVPVENPILDEVRQYPIELAYEQIHIGRPTQGEYASAFPHFLTPMGTIETPEALAERAMADWEAAE